VTNLKTSKSARVKVENRGPYANGRVLDVAPQVADRLDLKKSGVTPVVVAPNDGSTAYGTVKLGAGAAETNPQESKSQMGGAH
jgi:rare lipoprotein A